MLPALSSTRRSGRCAVSTVNVACPAWRAIVLVSSPELVTTVRGTLAGYEAVPIALCRVGVRIGQGHVTAGASARHIAAALGEQAQGQLLPVTRLQTARAAVLAPGVLARDNALVVGKGGGQPGIGV